MRNTLKFGIALAVMAIGAAPQMQAQTAGTINATVTVLSALSFTTQRDLAFGNIAPTQTKTVAVTDAAAGLFEISGANSSAVTFSITGSLPTTLGTGLALGSWTGYRNAANDATAGGAAYTPANGYSQSLTLSATGKYYFFLGATLTATGATPGSYSAPINVSVIYN
jgi:hypothetical protein